MMYLVTITNSERGETSAFITHDKAEAERTVENFNAPGKSITGRKLFTARAPIEITEIEIR